MRRRRRELLMVRPRGVTLAVRRQGGRDKFALFHLENLAEISWSSAVIVAASSGRAKQ